MNLKHIKTEFNEYQYTISIYSDCCQKSPVHIYLNTKDVSDQHGIDMYKLLDEAVIAAFRAGEEHMKAELIDKVVKKLYGGD